MPRRPWQMQPGPPPVPPGYLPMAVGGPPVEAEEDHPSAAQPQMQQQNASHRPLPHSAEVAALQQQNEELRHEVTHLRGRLGEHEKKGALRKVAEHPFFAPAVTAIVGALGAWLVASWQSRSKISGLKKLLEERQSAHTEAAAIGERALEKEEQLTDRMATIVANGS